KYRFNWTAPIAVSYHNPNEVYIGANVVFRSTDGGSHWKVLSPDLTRNDKAKQGLTGGPVDHDISGAENYDTIQSISLARTNPKVIWVGTDDGLVWVTRNGGKTWQRVTPSGAPAWARVYQIGVSPFHAGSAYLSFDAHELGNNRPYVYRTSNYGRSWHRIDRSLPQNSSVLVVREDPNDRGFLVAGTMTGVYYSHDHGAHWHPLTANLPTLPVWDLKFVHHPDSLVLASHGRGLWVLDNLKPLEAFTHQVAQSPFTLFKTQPG
ncbi:glycosyl hydrolase, BNR repeat-containing protein, partial [mine drainage metagenome]